MKKRWGINRKTLTAIIVFTLLINIISCICGSIIFDRAIQKLYNDKGYVVANIILNDIDHDKIAQYATTWEADDYYSWMVEYRIPPQYEKWHLSRLLTLIDVINENHKDPKDNKLSERERIDRQRRINEANRKKFAAKKKR